MSSTIKIKKIYKDSFSANIYTNHPFRMIGLIDVDVKYKHRIERVTLAYYRSSGTNNGKKKGLWYPIVGIKMYTGEFTEFTPYLNEILTLNTSYGMADEGWLCKSIFFYDEDEDIDMINGFSSGKHYKKLLKIGRVLEKLYEKDEFYMAKSLDVENYNNIITSSTIYRNNKYSQRRNYEKLIKDILDY